MASFVIASYRYSVLGYIATTTAIANRTDNHLSANYIYECHLNPAYLKTSHENRNHPLPCFLYSLGTELNL